MPWLKERLNKNRIVPKILKDQAVNYIDNYYQIKPIYAYKEFFHAEVEGLRQPPRST